MFSSHVIARSVINFLINLGGFYANSKILKVGRLKSVRVLYFWSLVSHERHTIADKNCKKNTQETSNLWSSIYSNMKCSFLEKD